jgi:hypothetical protein
MEGREIMVETQTTINIEKKHHKDDPEIVFYKLYISNNKDLSIEMTLDKFDIKRLKREVDKVFW